MDPPPSWRAALLAAAAVLSVGSAVGAETAPLQTDRPGQWDSPVLLPPGELQFELGAALTTDRENGRETVVTDPVAGLMRLGLSRHLELRLFWGGPSEVEIREPGRSRRDDGLLDAAAGIKLHLADERGRRPRMALLALTSLPVGDDGWSSERFDPNLRFSASQTLGGSLVLSYNLGLELATAGSGGDRSTTSDFFHSLAAAWSLNGRWSAFAELYGWLEGSSDAGSRQSVDAGVTYLVNPDLQLDAWGGVGLSGRADDWFVATGLSVRARRASGSPTP